MNPTDSWQPTAKLAALQSRARLLREIRNFFALREVMEVETPLISAAGNTDPEIDSIRTDNGRYLRTSPEFALKRLLAAGSGDIFELGRVFRNGETGRYHNPEFTMLEWYRTGFSYHELMDEVADLVRKCGAGVFDNWPLEKLSYRKLFQKHIDLDPYTADVSALMAAAKKHGIEDIELNRKQWLELLISHIIQPNLPNKTLTFVFDVPADQASLAKIRQDTPPVAERFELYLGQTELANGYQELTDANEQKSRFEAENSQRINRGEQAYPMDLHLIAALQHGLPECAGVALGVDRLLLQICGADNLRDILAFPITNT